MSKLSLLLFLCAASLCSCNFSKGVKKDLSTGLTSSYNGFTLDDIYLVDQNDNRLGSNQITLGSVIKVLASGVNNFQEKNGKVYPGCGIVLTDKSGKEILNLADAFAELTDGIEQAKASVLKATLTTGEPMKVGETYHFSARFFDKNKKENEIKADIDIVMK